MKRQPELKQVHRVPASRTQKIWGVVALIGLFACGLTIGLTWDHGPRGDVKHIGMTDGQCANIANEIVSLAQGTFFGRQGKTVSEVTAELRELNDIYNKNCAGRVIDVPKEKPQPVKQENTADKETCEVIEQMLLGWIGPETDMNPDAHYNNIATYEKLVKHGCPQNAGKYRELIEREQDIISALTGEVTGDTESTCSAVENALLERLPYAENHYDSRIYRAQIYANLSERGCPENSQKYVDLAARELEIARALRDDKFDTGETIEVVETYKRLQMKQTAKEVFDKVQKLTDPTIDFIIQVQKIIEE